MGWVGLCVLDWLVGWPSGRCIGWPVDWLVEGCCGHGCGDVLHDWQVTGSQMFRFVWWWLVGGLSVAVWRQAVAVNIGRLARWLRGRLISWCLCLHVRVMADGLAGWLVRMFAG